jgi:hypothetical protein
MELYHRESHLKEQFNNFISQKITHEKRDYYSLLTDADLEEFKSLLSQINNIFTLRTTNLFLLWIEKNFGLSSDIIQSYSEEINTLKPNSNGFDVRLDDRKILAEVKCNKPFLENTFGSAQKNGIIKDINGLLFGKAKEKINTNKYFKFLVVYDFGVSTYNAVTVLIRNLKPPINDKVVLYNPEIEINKNNVYVLILKP